MMNFREWAIQNPTLMSEYEELQQELVEVLGDIAEQEQIIEDATDGIAPEKRRGGLFMNDGLFSAFLLPSSGKRAFANMMGQVYTPTPEDEAEDEAFIIEQKKSHHQQTLSKAVDDARRELDGWTYDLSTFGNRLSSGDPKDIHVVEGLYEKKKRLDKAILEFNPADHVIDWRADKEEGLGSAIEQRLRCLGFRNVSHSTGDILDCVIDCFHYFVDDFHFELKYRVGWITRLGDKSICFTRYTFDESPRYSIQRALLSYLESRWEFLFETLEPGIEDEV